MTGHAMHNDGKVKKLLEIGVSLSAEQDIGRLLERIIDGARELTHADGGTLYIMSENEDVLRFAIVQNDTLGVRMGGTGASITWHPVSLYLPDGTPNTTNVSAHAALSRKVVCIADVYDIAGFNFEGTKTFDGETGYRSRSMLVVPMLNHDGDVIGVMQLLNALDVRTGEVRPFSPEDRELTEALASQAAVALTNNRLLRSLEVLMDALIRTIATAIDEKSPYTGGHVRRVAEITMHIAEKVNECQDGPFASVCLSKDELRELRIAAWLHDVGKITVPEYVMDKSTKMQNIYDRMELVRTRCEVLKRDWHLSHVGKAAKSAEEMEAFCRQSGDTDDFCRLMGEVVPFLESLNAGDIRVTQEGLDRLQRLSRLTWNLDGVSHPFLTEEELHALAIRQGTLSEKERRLVNKHACMTRTLLEQLPFPKKWKNVPVYAGQHHERPDGSGYPDGIKGKDLPLQSRIIALADIFEALTASDRPYRRSQSLEEAMTILGNMARNQQIDPDLFALFVREEIHLTDIRKEPSVRRRDAVRASLPPV